MFDTITRIREKNAQLLCGSAIFLALSISGCTTSGSALLEGAANDVAIAKNNISETSGAVHPVNSQTDLLPATTTEQAPLNSTVPVPTASASTNQLAEAIASNPAAEQTIAAQTAIGATNQLVQTTENVAPVAQPSTLAALFGTRNKPTATLNAVVEPNKTTPTTTQTQAVTATTPTPPESNQTAAAPATTPATDRTSQSAGTAARLFSPGKNSLRGEDTSKQPATIASAQPKKTADYNYSLPGVRANAGVEIRHSNKVFDESDIDLDEDDFSAPVTLASVGGMARLTPNGLRTQHAKVQVSCLKPQLVSMIKRLETHYRKPVVITSGYRSPSHNRSVSGAKRSFHMSCAAADLQIPGVSKWEIAQQVRKWPGRGGVGTYCHTESVHIDVGPERDWNWRCRRG